MLAEEPPDPTVTTDKSTGEPTESDTIELDTPLKRFITILFEPHFKFLTLISALLSTVCCLNDLALHLTSHDKIEQNIELSLSSKNRFFIIRK